MSEPSEDKSKRNYIDYLLLYPWSHQTSVFYGDEEESRAMLDHLPRVKRRLRRTYPDQPFLLRLGLRHHTDEKETRAWFTIFSNGKQPGMIDLLQSITWGRALYRSISESQRLKAAKTISRGKPHKLKEFFGRDKVNRFALLNEAHLPESSEALKLCFLEGVTSTANVLDD